ncbi:substrate-binding periplasmic protein [Thalassotalea euphylliae]|uniref:Solute-binding protein family 3/N-terminal domain-containing protein n=1 Tax=Thalassotalea euphylliae TaxID=1655234 RepID=A0A3E0UH30_9GAMM|nr:transporter substrate-binding domain-containing protein [Thalassotalea euphylliae]REL36361.1 hypothetical protein DXX92_14150 [Thalassotalea euphylliae]
MTINIANPMQAYPPYHWLENGEIKGLVPDIIEAAAKLVGEDVEINYVPVPWLRMFSLAENGDIDAIFPVSFNQERAKYLNFVPESIVMERMNLVSSSAFDISFSGDLTTLANYKVAGIIGYYYGEAYTNANLETLALANEEQQVEMLLGGQAPLALMDANILPYYINKLGGEREHRIKVLEPHLYEAPLHLAFAKNGRYPALVERFNSALAKLKSTPDYQNILQTYLSQE